ncbi:helix-turn-helix domain-containing protein, partial [Staphylococcus cohnii]|uniref:helix-turn-helix domain-containing protein n=1 Tax=Staphylococcus cohnii TaxID=29382 RepID=UPI000A6A0AD3
MTHRKLSPETYQKAFSLYEEGYSMKNVIQKLNCSPRTLLINYYKFKKHGIK